jgi:hypothetical protein
MKIPVVQVQWIDEILSGTALNEVIRGACSVVFGCVAWFIHSGRFVLGLVKVSYWLRFLLLLLDSYVLLL